MTGHKRLFAIGITIALLAATAWGEERTWTDATGKFSVTAELEEVRGNKVLLRRQDGKQITVPLAKLSAEDQQFLTQHTAENPFQERQSLPVLKAADAVELLRPANGPANTLEIAERIPGVTTGARFAGAGGHVPQVDLTQPTKVLSGNDRSPPRRD